MNPRFIFASLLLPALIQGKECGDEVSNCAKLQKYCQSSILVMTMKNLCAESCGFCQKTCSINGINYPHGHETYNDGVHTTYCFKLSCDKGTWVVDPNDGFAGSSTCQACVVTLAMSLDLALLTPLPTKECSFSAIQEGNSSSPSYYTNVKMTSGLPVDFEFKENDQSAITCSDVSNVNSCSTGAVSDTPKEVQPGVYAFSFHNNGILMGPTFTVQFASSPFLVYVPVTAKNSGNLNGVCGNYNGIRTDDFALRDGTSSSSVTGILESWAVGTC